MRRKGNPLTLLVGMQVGMTTLENSIEVPQEVENRATLGPSNRITGYLTKEYENTDSKRSITSHQSEWLKLTSQETTEIGEDAEKGEPSTLLVGMQTGATTLENNMEVPQKVKNRATL